MEPVVGWCLENGIRCKGHPLAWTQRIGLPDYVLELGLEDSEMLLHARIQENVKGFQDRITMWDVVNEPVNTVTWEMAHADTSKENQYRRDIPVGEIADWVEPAYRAAYRADPENNYILNEFRQIADPEIRRRFQDLVNLLLEREAPISGLGIQAHEPREEWYDTVEVWETLEEYSEFRLPLHITEFSPQ
jgi:GH35 family endo-1,4-beta-xylanase